MDSTLKSQHLFYNNSRFDLDSVAANPDDDFAVVIDKSPLRTGETATFENYTSYWHGINGLMLDVTGLKAAPTLSDFEFRIGNNDDPNTWSTAPAPTSISVRPGDGVGSTDRVSLVWADGAIKNTWLQVQLLATANTGLANDDIFYFGNVIAETGNDPATSRVNLLDVGLTRFNQTGFLLADIENRFDFNRDQRVNLQDAGLARANQTGFFGVNLITPSTFNRNGSSESFGEKSNSGKANDSLLFSRDFAESDEELKAELLDYGKQCPSAIGLQHAESLAGAQTLEHDFPSKIERSQNSLSSNADDQKEVMSNDRGFAVTDRVFASID